MANVARRTDGRWRARYRDEHGREHARHFDRKIDAQRWLETVSASLHNGTYVDPDAGRTTFADFYAHWRERQLWAPRTVLAMDLAAGSVPFADLPLKSLRRSHVEHWVKQMVRRGLAPGTVHTRVNNVRAILRGAVTDRLIASDPSAGVALPRRRRKDMAMTLPTPDQVGAVMAAAGEDFRPFVALCAFAGLRLGEAAAVRVEDIDFLRRTLHVARQVQPAERKSVDVRPPKYGSERIVSLPSPVVDLLAGYLTDHAATDGWLFTGTTGEPVHHNTVGFRWRSALQAAGLSDIRLHDLRHFYASGLIAAGCDVVTVQRALGHATATTTLTTYSHLWPTAEDRTRRAAEQLFSDSCGPGADCGASTSR